MTFVITFKFIFGGEKMKKLNQIFGLLLITATLSFGQIGFSVDTNSGYTSNAFANHNTLPDYYTSINASLNHDWLKETEGFRWSYKGSLDVFQKYNNRNFQNHSTGISYYNYFSESGHRLNAGLFFGKRFHTEDYAWYEIQQYNVYVNSKFIIADQTYGYIGMNIRWRDYVYLDAFSHYQTTLFFRISQFFQTGTTLIAKANWLTKNYYPSSYKSNVVGLPEIVTIGEGSSQQFVSSIKAAQSLSPSVGISMQFLLRKNIISSIRYLGTDTGFYYSDEELFDDKYGYSSEEFTTTLKKRFPWKIEISLGANFKLKHYDSRLALDLDGYPYSDERLRSDNRLVTWLSLTKSFKVSNSLRPISISFNWSNINNVSNDPYYEYDSSFITFGISQSF